MPFPGILDGFETPQKQFFAYFWSQEKNKKKIKISRKNRFLSVKIGFFRGKIGFYRKKSVFIGKIGDFSPIFFFRFFHCKIFSKPTEIRFFSEKSANFGDFFVLGYETLTLGSTTVNTQDQQVDLKTEVQQLLINFCIKDKF